MSRERTQAVLEHIGANVRKLRERRELTQESLAEAAEVDLRYLQAIERGRRNLSVGILVALADALGVKPGMLFRKRRLPSAKRGRPRKRKPKTLDEGK